MNNAVTSKGLIKTYIIILMMYSLFVGKFVVTKTGFSSPPLMNYVAMLLSLLLMIPLLNKYGLFLFKYVLLLVVYIGFKSLIWGMEFMPSLITYSGLLWCFFFCAIMIEGVARNEIDYKKLKKHFYLLFAFEGLLALSQYLIPSLSDWFYIDSWTWNDVTRSEEDNTESFLLFVKSPTIGTLLQPQIYANIISIFIIIALCDILYNPKEIHAIKYSILLIGFVTCFLSGIRTPLLMVILMISYIIYKYKRKWFVYYILGIVAAVVIFMGKSLTDDTGSAARMQLGLLAISSGNSDLLMEQTIGYSLYMIPYFLHNPIFGISLGDKYVLGRYVMSDFSSTDVQLMYYLCEIGIVGLLLILWPIIKFSKISGFPRMDKRVKPILWECLLLTILDDTFLGFEAKFLFALSFGLFFNVRTDESKSAVI